MNNKTIESMFAYCPVCKGDDRTHWKIIGEAEGLGESKLVIYKCDNCQFSYTNTFLAIYQARKRE